MKKENGMFYLFIVAVIFVLDNRIKNHIEKNYKENQTKKICSDKIMIQRFHNTGAFLSSFKNAQKAVAAVSGFFTVFLGGLWTYMITTREGLLSKTGISFMLGGALSNTYDRIKKKYVVDYFSFVKKKKGRRRVIYNLSDWFIFIGSFLVVTAEIFKDFIKK